MLLGDVQVKPEECVLPYYSGLFSSIKGDGFHGDNLRPPHPERTCRVTLPLQRAPENKGKENDTSCMANGTY